VEFTGQALDVQMLDVQTLDEQILDESRSYLRLRTCDFGPLTQPRM